MSYYNNMDNQGLIYAVVVTYNRKLLLKRCIDALLSQTRKPEFIIIIDNSSTDGTDKLIEKEFNHNNSVLYHRLDNNSGGAGGFHSGTKLAVEDGAGWVWLMDDDCVPEKDCLKNLMRGVDDVRDVYSPVILSHEDKKTVLWGIKAQPYTGKYEGISLPFNGFLAHRETIQEIGFPDKRFFIYGDDTEYNLRARSSGRKIIMNADSIMYHPFKNQVRGLNVLKMFTSKIWVYYKLRNAIIIYNKYGHYSTKQILLLVIALFYFILTLKFSLAKLWFDGLRDGLKNNLYARDL
jgi:rhamnopyranosyl-N-acetylglucosaminyl-diphospho-decaprenol beta-1,3/1,4-galactofuranosyltransferase